MSAPVTEAHLELAKTVIFSRDSAGRLLTAPMGAQLIADSEALATAELKKRADHWCDMHTVCAKERDQLRAVFPQICEALGNGSCCAPDVSLDFLQSIPNEVAGVVAKLRAEVERLKDHAFDKDGTSWKTVCGWWSAKYNAAERQMSENAARAERAEADADSTRERALALANSLDEAQAELAAERAIVSRIWVQLGSPTYEQLKGRSIYCLIDELKAELATERARLDWLEDNAGDIPRYHSGSWIWIAHQNLRFAIDAAMKEGSA